MGSLKFLFFLPPLVILIIAISPGALGKRWKGCDCRCIKPECDFPKTLDQCKTCARAVGRSDQDTSFDEGYCWVKVTGKMDAAECALKTYAPLLGCSGFNGYTHYTYNNNCWAKFKPPTGGRSTLDEISGKKKPTVIEGESSSQDVDDIFDDLTEL